MAAQGPSAGGAMHAGGRETEAGGLLEDHKNPKRQHLAILPRLNVPGGKVADFASFDVSRFPATRSAPAAVRPRRRGNGPEATAGLAGGARDGKGSDTWVLQPALFLQVV